VKAIGQAVALRADCGRRHLTPGRRPGIGLEPSPLPARSRHEFSL
jgi:hypothetical protein